jgi:2,4-dienoyl-CoA reductase-like NADH-dependent reductase (Old Yellow Enzyme family)
MTALTDPLSLPCGGVLPNRLGKAAMTEGLADVHGVPTPALDQLYRRWAGSGCGLLISGNVQIDRGHLERPGNVILDRPADAAMLAALSRWAQAAKMNGAQLWMQINHAGRQTPIRLNATPKAPSAVPLALPGKQFGVPVALTEAEIVDLIGRFAAAAASARAAGFDGVQIHAAHGYLLSSFLNPRANVRSDAWGGSLAGRARMLMETVAATRTAVGADFPISVKINSADFQAGGFSFEDCVDVAQRLASAGVDLIELSGGNYEQPRMMAMDGLDPAEQPKAASTRAREAYFLDFAKAMLGQVRAPLMVTGGIRSAAGMAEALDAGVALLGIGRPLCVDPHAPAKLLAGQISSLPRIEDTLRLGPGWLGPASPIKMLKAINGFAVQSWYYQQLRRLAAGAEVDMSLGAFTALWREQRDQAALLKS